MNKLKHNYLYEDSLPLALPLPTKTYSLETDMLMGWRPKFIKSPVSLNYYDESYTEIIKKKPHLTVFKGYRAKDSFVFHQFFKGLCPDAYPYDFSDKSLTAYKFLNKNKSDTVKYGMKQKAFGQSICFDSAFESGNLDKAIMIGPYEYDLYMRPDTNTSSHMHWFYFSVSGFTSQEKVKLNIVNFSRPSPLFKAGMKPKAFSQYKFSTSKNYTWENFGENVNFGYSKLNKFLDPDSTRVFYMLSFEFIPSDLNDKLWIATTIPYTFSRLWKVLRTVKGDEKSYETAHVELGCLGKSLSLVDIPLVTIGNSGQSACKKKIIVAVGRVHPSETVGSWVIEGFLRFIASHSPEARRLRNTFVFKIVPMCNPDGVIIGNSRTSLNGEDLNRRYTNPSEKTQPEAKLIKDFIQSLLQKGEEIFMFLDFHGHFCKKNSFLYGPVFPLHDPNYFNTKILAKLLSERTNIFRYHSSRFSIEKGKDSTARMVIWKELGIVHTYTLETSYFGYMNEDRETIPFGCYHFYELAEKLALTILDCFSMQEKMICKAKTKEKVKKEASLNMKPEKNTEKIEENEDSEEDKSENSLLEWVVPAEKIEPLLVNHEKCVQKNREEIIQMIKSNICENENIGDESASAGSCSDSEEGKTLELPKIDRKRGLSSDFESNWLEGIQSSKGKKLKLSKKFARRIEKIKRKMKNEMKISRMSERTNANIEFKKTGNLEDFYKFPAIVSVNNSSKK